MSAILGRPCATIFILAKITVCDLTPNVKFNSTIHKLFKNKYVYAEN
jgi:hypothetical protein